MVDTSIIIPTYNGKKYLDDCLSSVLNQTYNNYEVILVENGGSDDTVNYVMEKFTKYINIKKLKLIVVKENKGFVGGNNEGVKHIHKDTQYIVLLSNDTKVKEDWLEKLLPPLKMNGCGVIGSLVLNKGSEEEINKYYNDGKKCTLNLCVDTIDIKKDLLEEDIKSVFYVGGCALAYNKDITNEPFWIEYFSYGEDIYLCWLAQLKGYKIFLNNKAIVYHSHGGATKNATKEMYNKSTIHGIKNLLINYFLFYEWFNIIRFFPLLIITQIGHIIHQPRKFKYQLLAYKWIINNFNKILLKRKEIQKQRVVYDRELIKQMSYKIYNVDDVNGIKKYVLCFMNFLFCLYCQILFVRTWEGNIKCQKI